ncbi:MAG TPA: lytic transglycosylase domain-containing protein [Burkholderiaceae bacterium]|jgi:soluble lytic murein transglycosylase-like protein|nr:lytic transglycosylase domain-containing protein [Burkholderiaceae bacterium]
MRATDVSRRNLLIAGSAGVAVPLLLPFAAKAGAQQYEPMADAVRVALAAQIADTRPPARRIDKIDERIAYLAWVGEMSERLGNKVGDYAARVEFLKTLDYEAKRAGLDRQLVLSLIQIESNFRKYAISIAGARGLMQVMPFWTRVIGDGESRHLFSMRTNLRYGTVILRHYLDIERGDLFMALGRYNGSRGRAAYPDSILAAWKNRWAYEPKPSEQAAPNSRVG